MSADQNLRSRLELSISCRNLPSLDTLSKSDPMVVLFQIVGGRPVELGRTEVQKNNDCPAFAHRFVVDYFFETVQNMLLQVYDADSKSNDLLAHDFLGEFTCTIASIVAKPGRKVTAPLVDKSKKQIGTGTITVYAEELKGSNQFLQLQIFGQKLDKKDWFGKSDPYLTFHKRNPDGGIGPVIHRTEVIKNTLDPQWLPFDVAMESLCNGDVNRHFVIKCFDWDSDDKSEYIGEIETTILQLQPDYVGEGGNIVNNAGNGKAVREFILHKPEKSTDEKRMKPHGKLILRKCFLKIEPTFLDYIRGGMQINLMLAVDFTGSNGDPRDPQSLHYRGDKMSLNPYQRAILAVTDIVLPYDADGNVTAWGFGAKLAPNQPVLNCFSLNLQPNPEVPGVAGVMNAYHNIVDRLVLSGPTLFAPILVEATRIAMRPFAANYQHYNVLLIITDGVINDMDETLTAIVRASDKPLSIIIVGVGTADFTAMNALDGDGQRLRFGNEVQKRDNVQFVAMRDFAARPPADLAAATLAELPQQVLDFMRMHRIAPLPALQAQATSAALHGAQYGAASSSSSSSSLPAPPPYTAPPPSSLHRV